MTQWQTEAVVLAADPQGESDLWVRLLTPGQGRIAATAKGALRSRERFLGALDPPRIIAAGLGTTGKSGRLLLEFAEVKIFFPSFREDPRRLARAAALTELAEMSVAESEPSPRIYRLLTRGLARLEAEPDTDRWMVATAYRLLSAAGYQPLLDHCANCHRPLNTSPSLVARVPPPAQPHVRAASAAILFSPASGGLICDACAQLPYAATAIVLADAIKITADTVRTLLAVLAAPDSRLARISFTRPALAQARAMLNPFIAHHLPRPLRSLQFLDELRGGLSSGFHKYGCIVAQASRLH